MKNRTEQTLKKAESIIESYKIGEESYSPLIDSLIQELMQVKNELKKGMTKKFFRKEASRIQNAIQSLRYLKKRSEKMLNKDKVLISESELIEIVDKLGMLQVEKVNITRKFSGAPSKFISGVSDVISAITPDTSAKNNPATSREVMTHYRTLMGERSRDLIRAYSNPVITGRIAPSMAPSSIFNDFTITHFYSPINLGKYIISTYDKPPSSWTPPAGMTIPPGSPPGVGYYVSEDPKQKHIQIYDYNQKENIRAQVNGSLNIIVKGFNSILRGISDLPEDAGYKDSPYAARTIANDIANLTKSLGVFDEDSTQHMNKIILNNISEKQAIFFTLDSSAKKKLSRDAVKKMARVITKDLLSYYIISLQNSYRHLETFFKDHVLDTVAAHPPHASRVDKDIDSQYFLEGINITIESLKSLKIKD